MITYIQGDVTKAKSNNNIIICHVVNDAGRMGSGVAKALYTKWPIVRSSYIKWASDEGFYNFELGKTQFVCVDSKILVANMVAQHETISVDNPHPLKYDALESCMREVELRGKTTSNLPELHCPKFGSLRAGGDFQIIEKMIQNIWKDFDVTIYEYKE